ncbi:MAG: glycosyltransferase [Proteobacteria bacterium]|nr:glycosyltransferase [Pseudomonadota bacterium]
MNNDEIIEVSDPVRLVADPLVSVLIFTYNHVDFIANAIEGVLAQRCDFTFELIIGEDASSDGTLDLVLDYQRRYPEIIRAVHSGENVGANANSKRLFARARGEFVSFCDGDDYWCSSDKLQRQVNLLRADPGAGIVHADWFRIWRNADGWEGNPVRSVHRRVAMNYLEGQLFPTWHFPKILRTSTILLRRKLLEDWLASGLCRKEYRFGDSVLSAYATSCVRVAYLPEVVTAYRQSAHSILRSGASARVSLYKSCLEFDTDARAYFSSRAAYSDGYRWDCAVALLAWAVRARDFGAAAVALKDIHSHFSFVGFFVTGWRSIRMRMPTWRQQPRSLPAWHGAPNREPRT